MAAVGPLTEAERAEIQRFIRVLDYEKHSGAEHRAVGYLMRLWNAVEHYRAEELPSRQYDSLVAEMVTVLKAACDRNWTDETPIQVAIIAANAIHWREREIAAVRLREEAAHTCHGNEHMPVGSCRLCVQERAEEVIYEAVNFLCGLGMEKETEKLALKLEIVALGIENGRPPVETPQQEIERLRETYGRVVGELRTEIAELKAQLKSAT